MPTPSPTATRTLNVIHLSSIVCSGCPDFSTSAGGEAVEIMQSYSAAASLITLVLGLAIAWIVYAILGTSLRELLNQAIRLPSATTFYLRSLALIVTFIALSKGVVTIQDKQPFHFMDYVWASASATDSIFEDVAYFVLVYLALITIVVVVLKPKNER